MTKTIACALFFILTGCASGVIVPESGKSIEDIDHAILAITGDPRKISGSKREITSAYFSRRKEPHFDPQKAKERLYAVFTILGDRRPYDIEVRVFAETLADGEYQDQGLDDAFTEEIARELKQQLARQPNDRDFIDDFRAF